MAFVTLDYETKSACDLKKCGAAVYAQHPSTDVTFLGYSRNGDPSTAGLWRAGNWAIGIMPDPFPEDLLEMLFGGKKLPWLVAHNSFFEKMITRYVLEPRYHFPSLQQHRWIDTLAVCAAKALPLALDRAGMVLDLSIQKDKVGAEALRKIMKPQKVPKKAKHDLRTNDPHLPPGFGWNDDPALYRITGDYCLTDIGSEDALLERIGTLTPTEQAVWELDQLINERGVRIDLDYVSACKDVVAQACIPLAEEFALITGGQRQVDGSIEGGLKATQRDKVLGWIRGNLPDTYSGDLDEHGDMELLDPAIQLPNMQKDTVAEFRLRDDLPECVEEVMFLREDLTSSSIKKLDAMERSTDWEGIARGLQQYHAATTGRWGGRLIQPQNFPRGVIKAKPDTLVEMIKFRDAEYLTDIYGKSTVQVVASSLRNGIVARRGKVLVAADFSSIEARVVLALAGQDDMTALMAQGLDIYNALATRIFGYEVNRKAPEHALQGQMGKSGVLGCGFQMGPPRFKAQVKEQTGLIIPLSLAKDVVNTYRKDFAPKVPPLWYGLQDAATKCVWDGTPQEAYGITYMLEDVWLVAVLPSGKKLYYFNPQKVMRAVPWDETDLRRCFTYQSMKAGKWVTVNAYGGLLTENVVQAIARDLMADRMFAVEMELGFPIILTVHDEVVSEVEEARADYKAMEQVMSEAPYWGQAMGIPVQAEGWMGDRYRK